MRIPGFSRTPATPSTANAHPAPAPTTLRVVEPSRKAAGPQEATSRPQGHDSPGDLHGNHLPPPNDPAAPAAKQKMSMGDKIQVASNVAMGASMIAPLVQPLFQKKQPDPPFKLKENGGDGPVLGDQAEAERNKLKADVLKQAPQI